MADAGKTEEPEVERTESENVTTSTPGGEPGQKLTKSQKRAARRRQKKLVKKATIAGAGEDTVAANLTPAKVCNCASTLACVHARRRTVSWPVRVARALAVVGPCDS